MAELVARLAEQLDVKIVPAVEGKKGDRNASRSPFFPSTAGTIFTSSCSASLATSSAMTSWGFRSTTTPNFLRFTLLQGIAILLHGSTSSSVEIAPLECVDHSQLNASRDRGRPSHPIC